ncbi:ankyrin repeat protein [Medicago truncatula]|uniref:Ankyrin repeat protein n=1 Tax=Medicago truncatula TaxID=3880 RepID=G7IQD9_MEDTR|nr:ankyrin repeat protein [Medicago truncatula]
MKMKIFQTKDSNCKSLILFAIKTGKLDVLKLLVANGCRINDSVDFVLHKAATMDIIDVVKFLLESFSNELDVNSVGDCGVCVGGRDGSKVRMKEIWKKQSAMMKKGRRKKSNSEVEMGVGGWVGGGGGGKAEGEGGGEEEEKENEGRR